MRSPLPHLYVRNRGGLFAANVRNNRGTLSSTRCSMRAALICIVLTSAIGTAQVPTAVPRTWETRTLADWATPLANTGFRPGHFSEEEYYKAPVDNYRTYPMYAP